jgi:hypothetical protein
MFESMEIRRVQNGFVLSVQLEDETMEYVFDTSRKAMKFMKDYLEAKSSDDK